MAIYADVQIGEDGKRARDEEITLVIRGNEVFGLTWTILQDRKLKRAPVDAVEDRIRANAGGDHQRSGSPLPQVGLDTNLPAMGRDGLDDGALLDGDTVAMEGGEQRLCDHGQVENARLDVESSQVGVELRVPRLQALPGERLRPQMQAGQNLVALLGVRVFQGGGDVGLRQIEAAALDQEALGGLGLELEPELARGKGELGVERVQVVVANGPGEAERRGLRVTHARSFQDHDLLARGRSVVRGEKAHHPAADNGEVIHRRHAIAHPGPRTGQLFCQSRGQAGTLRVPKKARRVCQI